MLNQVMNDPKLLATYLAILLGYLALVVLGTWLWRRWLLGLLVVGAIVVLCVLAPDQPPRPMMPDWALWVGLLVLLAGGGFLAYIGYRGRQSQEYRQFRYRIVVELRKLGLPVEWGDNDDNILAAIRCLELGPEVGFEPLKPREADWNLVAWILATSVGSAVLAGLLWQKGVIFPDSPEWVFWPAVVGGALLGAVLPLAHRWLIGREEPKEEERSEGI